MLTKDLLKDWYLGSFVFVRFGYADFLLVCYTQQACILYIRGEIIGGGEKRTRRLSKHLNEKNSWKECGGGVKVAGGL